MLQRSENRQATRLIVFISPHRLLSAVLEYCIRHIFRGGFIFANFASLVLFANLSTHENIYLRSRRMNATCVRNTLLSSIANLTTRKNVLKSRFAKIRLAKYMAYTVNGKPDDSYSVIDILIVTTYISKLFVFLAVNFIGPSEHHHNVQHRHQSSTLFLMEPSQC